MTTDVGREEEGTPNTSRPNWQTRLHIETVALDLTLRDLREIADTHHEVSEDFDRAVASWEVAKQDINHFIGVWTARSRDWSENWRENQQG